MVLMAQTDKERMELKPKEKAFIKECKALEHFWWTIKEVWDYKEKALKTQKEEFVKTSAIVQGLFAVKLKAYKERVKGVIDELRENIKEGWKCMANGKQEREVIMDLLDELKQKLRELK